MNDSHCCIKFHELSINIVLVRDRAYNIGKVGKDGVQQILYIIILVVTVILQLQYTCIWLILTWGRCVFQALGRRIVNGSSTNLFLLELVVFNTN
jgi:hypothetical protein